MELIYISKHLDTHEKCISYLEKKRWGSIPTCPYCGSKKSRPKRLRHTCSSCKNSYSVKVGTVFENSNLPMNKWLMAISIILAAKKGISSMQLSRDISVNKNTAWLLQMKIRAAMKNDHLELIKTLYAGVRTKKFTKKNFTNRSSNRTKYTFNANSVSRTNFWTHLKRAIVGQYHQIEEYYLHRYIDEIYFKREFGNTPDRGSQNLINRMLFVSLTK